MPRGSCGAGQGSRSALFALSIKHVKPTGCSKVKKDLGFGLKVQNCPIPTNAIQMPSTIKTHKSRCATAPLRSISQAARSPSGQTKHQGLDRGVDPGGACCGEDLMKTWIPWNYSEWYCQEPYPVRTYCPTALVKVVGVLWIWVEDKAKISVLQLGLRSWLYETLAQSNHQTSNLLGTSTGQSSILSPYYLHIISILSPYAP